MDTRSHFTLTPERAQSLIGKLLQASKDVRAGATVMHVHVIVGQADAKGPWELILSVVNDE